MQVRALVRRLNLSSPRAGINATESPGSVRKTSWSYDLGKGRVVGMLIPGMHRLMLGIYVGAFEQGICWHTGSWQASSDVRNLFRCLSARHHAYLGTECCGLLESALLRQAHIVAGDMTDPSTCATRLHAIHRRTKESCKSYVFKAPCSKGLQRRNSRDFTLIGSPAVAIFCWM